MPTWRFRSAAPARQGLEAAAGWRRGGWTLQAQAGLLSAHDGRGVWLQLQIDETPIAIDALRAGNGHGLRGGVDAEMAVLTVAGFAALVGAAHESAQSLFPGGAPSSDAWRSHVTDLLLHGLEAS